MDLIERARLKESNKTESLHQLRQAPTIGERLILAREHVRMTQMEAARNLGLRSAGSISVFESNSRRPSLKWLLKLSELYGIAAIELLPAGDPYLNLIPNITINPTEAVTNALNALKPGLLLHKIMDNRMAPIFLKGDKIWYDPYKKPFFSGQFVVVRTNSGDRVCQVILKDLVPVEARVIHPIYALNAIPVTPDSIVGIVVELRRNFFAPLHDNSGLEDADE